MSQDEERATGVEIAGEKQKLLYGIERPSDLRKLPRNKVEQVADEIRDEILARVSQTGAISRRVSVPSN
jgi:hypothetical protein